MLHWVDTLKEGLPEYAKDTKLNLDAVIKRSSLADDEAYGCAIASAMATGNGKLLNYIGSNIAAIDGPSNEEAWTKEREAALTAAALMAQNNIWYPYVGGTTKARFEAYSLAASIVGKCHFCVKAHYETLKKEGYTVEQLRDIGRIAAVITSVARVLNS